MKSLLEGPAYSTVAGLALTSTNYEKAIDLLKSRYGQRQVIINSHMEHLLNLQAVTDSRELRKLRKLYDTIEQDIRGLRSLDVEVEITELLRRGVYCDGWMCALERLVLSRNEKGNKCRNRRKKVQVLEKW